MKNAVFKRFRQALPPVLKTALQDSAITLSVAVNQTVLTIETTGTRQESIAMFAMIERSLDQLCAAARMVAQASRLLIVFPFGVPIEIELETALAIQCPDVDEEAVDREGGVERLVALQERTEALLQMVPETAAIIDPDGTVLATNAPGLFSLGSDLAERVPEDRRANAKQKFIDVQRSGKAFYRGDGLLKLGGNVAVSHSIEIAPCGGDLMVLCRREGVVKLPIREVSED